MLKADELLPENLQQKNTRKRPFLPNAVAQAKLTTNGLFWGQADWDLVPNLPFTSKVAVLAIMAAHNKDVRDEVFATLKQRREMWRCMELWYVVMKPLRYLIEFHAIPIAAFRASCVCILKYMIDLKNIHKNYPLYSSVPCCLPMPAFPPLSPNLQGSCGLHDGTAFCLRSGAIS